MLAPANTEAFTLTAGLIASLATTTWLDTAPTGTALCCLLPVPQQPRSLYESPTVIEQRMRAVAEALHLSPATAPPPDIGPRLRQITPTEVALRVAGTPQPKTDPRRPPLDPAPRPRNPGSPCPGPRPALPQCHAGRDRHLPGPRHAPPAPPLRPHPNRMNPNPPQGDIP